jgi:hypothetical protein
VCPIHHWEELFHGDQHVDYLLADVIHDRLAHAFRLFDVVADWFTDRHRQRVDVALG